MTDIDRLRKAELELRAISALTSRLLMLASLSEDARNDGLTDDEMEALFVEVVADTAATEDETEFLGTIIRAILRRCRLLVRARRELQTEEQNSQPAKPKPGLRLVDQSDPEDMT